MKTGVLLSILCCVWTMNFAQLNSKSYDFEYQGVKLNGVLDRPDNDTPKGIVLIVHGSGRTNAVANDMYRDVREVIVNAGYGAFMWDKMGCGKSGGTFDYNQTVQSSAQEVIAAINALKADHVSGADDIGLWGISRAGWINPLVISQYKDIRFWISVSGVDAKENFKYLLRQNLSINGMSEDSVDLIVSEWQEGVNITHSGGSYKAYVEATQHLWNNPFMQRFGGTLPSEEGYYAYQEKFMQQGLDSLTGLPIYIDDFEMILSKIECPVLALFGEKDMNVDWRKTKVLYENTLGINTDLTIRSFSDGNHNLFKCKTGGFFEFQDDQLPWIRSEGFLLSIGEWLENR